MNRFLRVRELEASLGDPFDPASPINHELSARWDEEEHFPEEGLQLLRQKGIAKEFVPAALGGELRAYDELVTVARILASQNLTVAVTMSAMIWSTLVWISGDKSQQRAHADSILAFRTPCLAYSEEAHGADLLGNDTLARRVDGGYLLTGRKWPINRATTGQSVVLLARTGEPNHPRGQSLFWFEKSGLDAARHRPVPGVPTLGVRGTDISGIEFDEAFIPDTARLGMEGEGLEIALKGFHVTRTLCAGLSLGAVECALRTTVRLATTRRLYGDNLMALPQVRSAVVDAYSMYLALEAASLAAARMLHVSPSQSATISAATKHAIPYFSEQVLTRLAGIHGARFYIRNHHDWGVMQKVYRDNLLIAIFDGSSAVNLSSLATQLQILARSAPKSLGGDGDERREAASFERAVIASTVSADPPAFDGKSLDLVSRGDDMIASYGLVLAEIERTLEEPLRALLLPLLYDLKHAIVKLHSAVRANDVRRTGRGGAATAGLAENAERYTMLYVAVGAVHVWWRERAAMTGRSDGWIVLALRQLLKSLCVETTLDSAGLERIYEALTSDVLSRSGRAGAYSLIASTT
jgi:alkylation response protein AidB-like acyl-CoA dehydrogenase